MISPPREKSRKITGVERLGNALYLYSDLATHRLMPYTDRAIRLSYTHRETFSTRQKPGVTATPSAEWHYTEGEKEITLETGAALIRINRETACYEYFTKDGALLLQEAAIESRDLEEITTTILSDGAQSIEKIKTADGEKSIVKEARLTETGKAYRTTLRLLFADGEELYGFGQHEEGYGSLRGKTVYCHQANRKIALPLLVSNKGYGLLVDTYSPYLFNDTDFESYIYTEADDEMDFYFIAGGAMQGVVREYRALTGKASLLPKWAYGFWQSKERYESQAEIEEAVKEYRRRGIGIDCIVLDWVSWEGDNWGQKTLDPARFPAPDAMIETLHGQNVHFMISIWPSMHEGGENHKEFAEKGLFLPASPNYNAFSEEARALYWKQASEGLFCHGVDAWWCDSCEPLTPEWSTPRRTVPARQFVQYQTESAQIMDATETNAYALYHLKGLCEGQKKERTDKRFTVLSRSGYTGAQRYGAVVWSGDIAATWDTLRRQIAAGLGFCAAGMPYWTVDIGGFFVKRGVEWYWKGDYEGTTEDLGYRELFVRWFQWGCFLPIFRVHGTDCHRELWQFGDGGTPFYDALVKANRMRYELMPYIYSTAGKTWLCDDSMMRCLAFDYPDDETACRITDQYLFGDAIMVCPVTKPMYYGQNSAKLPPTPTERRVYLPRGKWYDYYTNEAYEGGKFITASAPLDKIPLFVKAGGIIPKAPFAPSTAEIGDVLDVYVYTGDDGAFTYYNDAGDGYGYEKGEYEAYTLRYSEKERKLAPCALLEKPNVTVHYI